MIHELFHKCNGWLYIVFGGNMKLSRETDASFCKWMQVTKENVVSIYYMYCVGMVWFLKKIKKTCKSSAVACRFTCSQ